MKPQLDPTWETFVWTFACLLLMGLAALLFTYSTAYIHDNINTDKNEHAQF